MGDRLLEVTQRPFLGPGSLSNCSAGIEGAQKCLQGEHFVRYFKRTQNLLFGHFRGALGSGVAKGLLQGRPLQLPMGWGVGEKLTKSGPTCEQLRVQNLALVISYCFSPTKSAYKIRLARSWLRVGHGLPTFDTNISVLKLQGSSLQ